MIRIAHFLRDDNKFIPDSMWCFDNCKEIDNTFFCISSRKSSLIRLNDPRVIIVSEAAAKEIVVKKCKYDIICLHSLYSLPLSIIPLISRDVKLVWYSWGYDIYMNPSPFSPLIDNLNIYLPETSELLETLPKDNISYKTQIKLLFLKIRNKRLSPNLLNECIGRIDYFAGVFPIEYDILRNKYSFFNADRISHNYIHPSEFKKENLNDEVDITDCNIQLGHSACPEDNHIDMMKSIVDQVDSGVKIICPLSYGGPKNYVISVIENGRYYFGDRFKAITDFLPFDEYTRLQKSCNRFVLGAIRQQATCNCLTAMWNGLQLYLNKTSMNYIQYRQFGLSVFDIDSEFQKTISREQHVYNRELIESIYSYRAWERDLKQFLEKYKNN